MAVGDEDAAMRMQIFRHESDAAVRMTYEVCGTVGIKEETMRGKKESQGHAKTMQMFLVQH
jgi:hypothetical protein